MPLWRLKKEIEDIIDHMDRTISIWTRTDSNIHEISRKNWKLNDSVQAGAKIVFSEEFSFDFKFLLFVNE